jgi:hypothetical protein
MIVVRLRTVAVELLNSLGLFKLTELFISVLSSAISYAKAK